MVGTGRALREGRQAGAAQAGVAPHLTGLGHVGVVGVQRGAVAVPGSNGASQSRPSRHGEVVEDKRGGEGEHLSCARPIAAAQESTAKESAAAMTSAPPLAGSGASGASGQGPLPLGRLPHPHSTAPTAAPNHCPLGYRI